MNDWRYSLCVSISVVQFRGERECSARPWCNRFLLLLFLDEVLFQAWINCFRGQILTPIKSHIWSLIPRLNFDVFVPDSLFISSSRVVKLYRRYEFTVCLGKRKGKKMHSIKIKKPLLLLFTIKTRNEELFRGDQTKKRWKLFLILSIFLFSNTCVKLTVSSFKSSC